MAVWMNSGQMSEESRVGRRVGTLGRSTWMEKRVVERAGRQLVVVGGEQVGGAAGRFTGTKPAAAHGAGGCRMAAHGMS